MTMKFDTPGQAARLNERVRDRMLNGRPFTYDDLFEICPDESWQRINTAIQNARRRGLLHKVGRRGQKTIWQAIKFPIEGPE